MLGLIDVMTKNYRVVAAIATKAKLPAFWDALLLQRRFDSLLEAGCAKLMSGLQLAHIGAVNASKKTSSDFLKFVFLSLSRPIFEAHNLLFEFLIARNQRRILYLLRSGDPLGLYQSLLELNEKGVALSRVIGASNINDGLCKSGQAGNSGDGIGHRKPNVK